MFMPTLNAAPHPANIELIAAAKAGNMEEVLKAINKGANPAYMDEDGKTARTQAAEAGHTNIVQYLDNLEDLRDFYRWQGLCTIQ
jgi:ankyrin repeat protein